MELNKLVASSKESEVDGIILNVAKDYMEEWFTVHVESNNILVKFTLKKAAFIKLKENMEHVLK